ncbi:SulP family inorganic anion transporter [Promicromonospora iranensis]|uniref:SulP family sulfate permease n=1 Tax=Promicromonospora iranensis TaxID=1105144 RepID=A0ABU2CUH7_9MICO|nr:SulP family inorganic anion transporter [Promicromonospora iranensis]MDR7384994.1 SulP family sulfate permease [Promicromonospora iranensis]
MTANGSKGDGPGSGLGALFGAQIRQTAQRAGRRLKLGTADVLPRRRHLRQDIVAGLPGAISSVPDGMAASVLAGVNPAHGLYASFVGPVAGGFMSSTRLMVVTTTSAAALAAGSALATYEEAERSDAMVLLTLLAGGLMIVAALLRLSRYIRFVSYSVMLGFLSGVAVNMVLGQLPVLFGVDAEGSLSVAKAWYVVSHLGAVDVASAICGGTALATLVLLGLTRWSIVSSLVALLVPTVGVVVLGATTVASVDDTGTVPRGLPGLALPDLSLFSTELVGGAAAVAAILLIQGAGVAEAVPNTDGSRSSTSRDFTAQGVANVAAGLFGGQPVGGSVGQTALNLAAGAASRWAAIWSGLWMGVILLAFSGVVGMVAMPTLAAVLIYAGVGALKPRELLAVARAGRISVLAMGSTFAAVLVLPVAQAVGVGVIASLIMQLNQEALDLRVVRLKPDAAGGFVETRPPQTVTAGQTVVLDAYGSLFYAGTRTLQRHLPAPAGAENGSASAGQNGRVDGPVVVLRLRGRTTLGATFLKVVGDYAHLLDEANGTLYLTGVDPALAAGWERDGTVQRLAGVRVVPATPRLGESTRAALTATAGRDGHGPVHHVRPAGDIPSPDPDPDLDPDGGT